VEFEAIWAEFRPILVIQRVTWAGYFGTNPGSPILPVEERSEMARFGSLIDLRGIQIGRPPTLDREGCSRSDRIVRAELGNQDM
jgi:hypothetical protein